MENTSIIIEIPVEVLHVLVRVEKEDPLNLVFKRVHELNDNVSTSISLQRLNALSRISSELTGEKQYSLHIIRDLWLGRYSKMMERNQSVKDETSNHYRLESNVPRLNELSAEGEVADIVSPMVGYIAHDFGIPYQKVLSHIRLENVYSDPEIIHLKVRIVQRKDQQGRIYWAWEEGPFMRLINENVEQILGLLADDAAFGIQ